jgi:tetratricopeptide (TPR) repeat protein
MAKKATPRKASPPRAVDKKPASKSFILGKKPPANDDGQGVGPAVPQPASASKVTGTPSPPVRKPGYYEAIAIYEKAVRALQKHDYSAAADQFRTIIERYPDERELQERSRLYLRVCERETARRPAIPTTPQERVYAATVALNAGDHALALDHLQRALDEAPESDHAHYIMAVALASRGQSTESMEHLRQSIALNPENRAIARQDPDLESIRELEAFREVLETPPAPGRVRPRPPAPPRRR